MAKQQKFLPNGEPDGRGQSDGSKANRFAGDRPGPGRPKGSKNIATIYREVGAIPVKLKMPNDRERRISTIEGVIRRQREKALNGDQRAAERFLDKIAEYSPPEVRPPQMAALLAEDAALLASARARFGFGVTPDPDERMEKSE